MKKLIIAAFVGTMSLAAVPASAMTAAPGVAAGSTLVHTIDDGCPRAYYRSYGRCVPYNRGYRGPRYRDGYYVAPRYYRAPRYYQEPRYYAQPRYYARPRYYNPPRYYGGQEYYGGEDY
jgi:hypothetical protein